MRPRKSVIELRNIEGDEQFLSTDYDMNPITELNFSIYHYDNGKLALLPLSVQAAFDNIVREDLFNTYEGKEFRSRGFMVHVVSVRYGYNMIADDEFDLYWLIGEWAVKIPLDCKRIWTWACDIVYEQEYGTPYVDFEHRHKPQEYYDER